MNRSKLFDPVSPPRMAWIPSAPLVPMGKTFMSPQAQRALPYTHQMVKSCVLSDCRQRILIQWMATAYRLSALSGKTAWKEASDPLILCTTPEGLNFTLWFASVYLGRLLTSKKSRLLRAPPRQMVVARPYTCIYLDLPENQPLLHRLREGLPPFIDLTGQNGSVVGVSTESRRTFPGRAGVKFRPFGVVDVETRRRLLLEMPAAARLLFDEPKVV